MAGAAEIQGDGRGFMYIYKITNRITGKAYIGQTTKSVMARWKQHQHSKKCKVFSHAIAKYGASNFIIETLLECKSLDDLNDSEAVFIEYYNTVVPYGYNLSLGGLNGGKRSEETKQLLSRLNKNSHSSLRTQFKPGHKIKSPRNIPGARNLDTAIKVRCIDTEVVYESMAECARSIGGKQQGVNRAALGQRKRYKGLRFEQVK